MSTKQPLREKCPNTELFLVRIQENNPYLDTFYAVIQKLPHLYEHVLISSAYEKYEYGHLRRCYIILILF